MDKEELIKLIKDLFEEEDISRIYKFEYKGKNSKGKKKFKIRYTPMFMANVYVDGTFEINEED